MNKNHGNQAMQPVRQMPTELIEQFLKNQAKELDLKVKELDLQRQSDSHSFQFAQSSLDAEVKDRDASRSHALRVRRTTFLFVFALAVILAAILCYSLHIGKDQIAMEIIKAIIFLITGGAGGYALGKSKSPDGASASK